MQRVEAHITTDRASRYLVQLCRHADQMGRGLPTGPGHGPHAGGERPKSVKADWSETDGTIDLDWGTCTLRATPEGLTVRVEAADEDRLQRVQALLTRNITRMGRRDHLSVDWRRPDGTTSPAPAPATAPSHRSRYLTLGLTLVAVLAVAVHAGLAAGVLAIPQWAGLGTDAVLGIILVMALAKAVLITAHLRRRRRPSAGPH
ncbi:DUF2218 domain-containing protein [Nonomuraea sp. CA-143628]|uniref:DUF2218 domain-containing protein n=1 Tax=Nonomuraea sp. CA-143628 TaxID=3239997 RepID=UPI003D8D8580